MSQTAENSYIGKSPSPFDMEISVESSKTKAGCPIRYSTSTQILEITFARGDIYQYYDVDKEDVEAIKTAQSVGKYLDSVIFKKYDCERIGKVQEGKVNDA